MIKQVLGVVAMLAFCVALIWGGYWVSKKLSYEWWYESQVENTVMEVLEREGLVGE